MIHDLAKVQSHKIGKNTYVWQFSIILENAVVGDNCNINCHVFIENDVIIADNVTIKPGVQVWDGIRIENNVFIGPNVTFVNDKNPRSKQYPEKFQHTTIRKFASIGANATILGGLDIGELSMIGAGSVVTKNIPARALVLGNPARIVAWLNKDGTKMKPLGNHVYLDNNDMKWHQSHDNTLIKYNE